MSRHSASRSRPSRSRAPVPEDADLARARVGAVLLPTLPPALPPALPPPDAALAGPRQLAPPAHGPTGWTLPPLPAAAPAAVPDGAPAAVPVPAADPGLAPVAPAQGVLAALRAGRFGLSAPGAVGLVGVALVCCLVAVLVAARDRPRPVAAPVVEQAGLVVPGPDSGAAGPSPAAAAPPVGAQVGAEVVVAVTGDVRRPGLVRLAAGSRVADALTAAGGLLPGADVVGLNPARLLLDGEQVLVGAAAVAAAGPPGAAPGGSAAAPPGAAPGPLDLNAASAADLDELPGIGPVLAERIVARREAHGPFRSVEQLREVEGIGPAKYESLRDLVRV